MQNRRRDAARRVACGVCVAGTDAFQQCKKIVDTPFPYPYAQAVLFMLTLYTIFAPFLICEIVNDSAYYPLLTPTFMLASQLVLV
jgi:predicted membrane chloride channel (bestrophin family)